MATSSRLRGNRNPIFTIATISPTGVKGTATSYSDDLKSFELSPKDKDGSDMTFYEAAQGLGKDWTLKLKLLVSYDTASLYKFLWTTSGDCEIVLGPWGNATPSAAAPHFKFTAILPGPPALANEASLDPVGSEVEVEIKGTSAPLPITA